MEGDRLWTAGSGTEWDNAGVIIVVAPDRAAMVHALSQSKLGFDYIAYECLGLQTDLRVEVEGGDDAVWAALGEFFRVLGRDDTVAIDWEHTPTTVLAPDPPEWWRTMDSHCGASSGLIYYHGAGDWAQHLPPGTVIARGP